MTWGGPANTAQYQGDHQGPGKIRPKDKSEPREGARAVNHRRSLDVPGHRLQCGKPDERDEGEVLPRVRND